MLVVEKKRNKINLLGKNNTFEKVSTWDFLIARGTLPCQSLLVILGDSSNRDWQVELDVFSIVEWKRNSHLDIGNFICKNKNGI